MLDYYRFKEVHDLFTKGKYDEAKRVLAELQEKYIEVHDENELLRTQLQEFEDVLYLAKNLEYDGHSYWLKTGTIKQGPFCQCCFDRDGLLIRLGESGDKWRCLSCGVLYSRDDTEVAAATSDTTERRESAKVIQLYK
ncbi:MAG: hypothetical protein ACOCWR_11510 [Oceanidesulfovibrio sp.]